jgi:hypothetical protein
VGDERKSIAACAHCDGVLRALDVRVVPPVRAEARDLAARLVTPTGLVTIGAIAFLWGAADLPVPLVNLLIGMSGLVALAATWFNLIDHVGRGKPGFPAPVEADGWPPATLASRGVLCLLLLCTPYGLWLARVRGADSVGELLGRSPLVGTLLGLGALAWLTAALLAMLVTSRALAAFWPPVLVRVIAIAPARYLHLYGLMLGTALVVGVLHRLATAVVGEVPFVSSLVVGVVTSVAVLGQAALVGGFVNRHREIYSTR